MRQPPVGPAGTSSRAAALLLVVLLVTSAALITAHLLHVVTGSPADWYWDLRNDRGYGEFLLYQLYLWLALFLLVALARWREPVLLPWALVALYLLADDMLGLHEHYGWRLGESAGLMDRWGELGGSVGELVYVGLTGLVLLTLVAVGHRFSGPFGRRVSRRLLVLVMVLVVVGVGVDAVHTLLSAPGRLEIALAVLEDGGEMVVLSVMTAFGLAVAAGPTDGGRSSDGADPDRLQAEAARTPGPADR